MISLWWKYRASIENEYHYIISGSEYRHLNGKRAIKLDGGDWAVVAHGRLEKFYYVNPNEWMGSTSTFSLTFLQSTLKFVRCTEEEIVDFGGKRVDYPYSSFKRFVCKIARIKNWE